MLLKFRFTLAIIMISIVCGSAQKVKIKKNIVYVDNQEVLNIQSSSIQGREAWIAITPSSDTVVTFLINRIELPLLPHESFSRKYAYYDISFRDSDVTGRTDIGNVYSEKRVAKLLERSGCFSADGFDVGCAELFTSKNNDWPEYKLDRATNAVSWRDSLLQDDAYLKFSSTLPKRNASLAIELLDDFTIKVFNVKIGSYKLDIKGSMSMTYRLFNSKNEPFGSVNYEYAKKRVFIRTYSDKKGLEYYIDHVFNYSDIYEAVSYFVDYGYM